MEFVVGRTERGQSGMGPSQKRMYPSRTMSGQVIILALIAVAALGMFGCKKPKKRILTKEQQTLVADSILAEAPKLERPLGANFGDKVELLGVEVEPKEPKPGQKASMIYYWRALDTLPGGWKVFVHLEQPGKRQILDHHPVRDFYPMSKWEKGQIIRDEQPFDVDGGFKPGEATVWVGIFDEEAWRTRQQSDRLPLVNPGDVANDGDNRVKAFVFSMQEGSGGGADNNSKPPNRRPPRYYARPAGGPITLDGKADEPAWANAPKTRVFLRPDGRPASRAMLTRAQLVYDDEYLYVAFDVKDSNIESPFDGRDKTLWKADVVELFIDPGADGRDYAELQVAPTNALFDAVFSTHRSPKWEEAAEKNLGLRSAVAIDGTLNQPGDEDKGWTVELAIPFADLPGAGGRPRPGTEWGLNMYRIDQEGPRNMAYQASWAPVGGDFHQLDGAGVLIFADAPPPAPEREGAPAPRTVVPEPDNAPDRGEQTPTPAPTPEKSK